MKLTASISAFFLVVGLMLIGIMAVNQATVNMGGSISFTATDVYARVTGSIANDTSSPSNLDVTYSAEETTGDPTVWNDLSLAFDSQATPIEVTITVENLSPQNTLRVNLNDTLSSTIGNLEKVVKNDGEDYTNQTDITLQPNGQENDSTTFTITMSVTNKNNSVTADFDYELNLEDQYYVPQSYEYFTFVVNSDGTTVTLRDYDSSLSDTTDIVIPESVSQNESGQWIEGNTYTVTDIFSATSSSNGVFYNSGITSIELPATLETIGGYAFYGCRGLTSIDLSNCTSLRSIGYNAFFNCDGLTSITLSSSLTSIGSAAFSGCYGLTSITLPSSLESIGNFAFDSCYALAEVYNYSNLRISDNGTNGGIGMNAKVVHNLSGGEKKPESRIQTIDDVQYYVYGDDFIALAPSVARDSLTTLKLDIGATEINPYAFRGCSGLTEVDLSNCTSLTSIGIYAFSSCSGLTSITLPSSLTSIGSSAFYNCSRLTTIRIEATTPPTLDSIIPSNATIEVPSASVEAYKSASGWSKYASQIVGY